jgi:flagellar hook-associated protein 2
VSTSSSSTTAPVSVASSSSSGAAGGSVINVSSLVSQLVAATRAPQDAIISQQTQTVTTEISALGTLKSSLSTFQDSLTPLDTPSAFNVEVANSSNSAIFTASATSGAALGSYSISVSQLAQAEQLVSKPFSGNGSTVVGTGALQVSLGGSSFSVNVSSTNDTLADIAAAINSASGNPGITAAVVNGTDGAHLLLSSAQSGAANTIQVAETDGGTGLSALTYSATNTANYTQASQAKDASFTVSGIPYTSPSNTVTSALPNVTLNLLSTTASGTGTGSSAQLTVASDTQTITSNIQAFVTAYNTMVQAITPLGSYDSTTGTAGPMLGDPVFMGIQNEIRSSLYSVVNTGSTTYNSLASIGITTNSNGTLSLNNATLQTALSSAPTAVSSLFSSANGVAATLNSTITNELGSTGIITDRSQTLVKQENALTQQTDDLNTQMTALTASLTQQYSSLNTLLSTLQSTSSYLSQQFASLPQVQGTSSA